MLSNIYQNEIEQNLIKIMRQFILVCAESIAKQTNALLVFYVSLQRQDASIWRAISIGQRHEKRIKSFGLTTVNYSASNETKYNSPSLRISRAVRFLNSKLRL